MKLKRNPQDATIQRNIAPLKAKIKALKLELRDLRKRVKRLEK